MDALKDRLDVDRSQLDRTENELLDGCDEELELAFEDRNVDALSDRPEAVGERHPERQRHFRELFHRQEELVKLQHWVAVRPQAPWVAEASDLSRTVRAAVGGRLCAGVKLLEVLRSGVPGLWRGRRRGSLEARWSN